ncbi:hypothetical protein ACFXJ5_34805 [Streptomyces sp. NPDC059373]
MLVDQGFRTGVVEHGAGLGVEVEIVECNRANSGFVPSRSAGGSDRSTA